VSLLSVPLTLLPPGLSLAGFSAPICAQISSGEWFVTFSTWAVSSAARARRHLEPWARLVRPIFAIPLGAAGIANLMAQLGNTTGWLFEPLIAIFFFGAVYALAYVAVIFEDIVTRPEWTTGRLTRACSWQRTARFNRIWYGPGG
jgi:hypothetical protein